LVSVTVCDHADHFAHEGIKPSHDRQHFGTGAMFPFAMFPFAMFPFAMFPFAMSLSNLTSFSHYNTSHYNTLMTSRT